MSLFAFIGFYVIIIIGDDIMNKEFWKAAGIRAVRTICQTAVASVGTAVALQEVNWLYVASASALAGILSILNSIATGLPEVNE